MKKVYVKLRDAGGSFTDASLGIKLGGAENVPVLTEKTNRIEHAIRYRALLEVDEKQAKSEIAAAEKVRKANNKVAKKAVKSTDKKAEEPTKETKAEDSGNIVANLLEEGNYQKMWDYAKECGETYKKNPSKEDLEKFLTSKLEK